MLRRLAVAAIGACCALLPASGGQGGPAKAAIDDRMATFETVWQTVNDRYFDASFNGIDWRAVHDEFAPRVRAATSDAEVYTLLNQMLDRLGSSHFSIRAPETTGPDIDVNDASWGGGAGMTIRIVEGRPTITAVETGGAAALAGLAPGFLVTSIAGTDLSAIYRAELAVSSEPRARFAARRAAAALLGGMPGSPVDVAFLDSANAPHTAKLVRQGLIGRPMRYGDMPTVLVEVETRQLADGVGYLRFNTFLPQLVPELRMAVHELSGCRAIVVDLRGNSGGMATVAPAVASLFLSRPTSLGTMKLRNKEFGFPTFVQQSPYGGRVVVLVDEATASTSEIFAGSLQEMRRATVAGEHTLGAVLPAVIQKLPNGAVFQFAVADFRTPNGVMLEGRGVVPDLQISPRRADYAAGRDPALEAAVASLTGQKRN